MGLKSQLSVLCDKNLCMYAQDFHLITQLYIVLGF